MIAKKSKPNKTSKPEILKKTKMKIKQNGLDF
jgi:hypothetical protein